MLFALTILFIGLRLMGFIDWSWFWVLSPVIAVFSFYMVVFVFALIAVLQRGG